MPNHTPLTYGQLHDKLRELGFQECGVELEGKRGRVFEHAMLTGTMIVLPERAPDHPVEPFYLGLVLAKLRAFNLLPEGNPLATTA